MAVTNFSRSLYSLSAHKKIGRVSFFGRAFFGFSYYGQEISKMADGAVISGVFRERVSYGKRIKEILPFMYPSNPRTEAQQANRQKITNGVQAWKNLTEEEKSVYNKKAIGKRMSGYNLFLRQYLKSN